MRLGRVWGELRDLTMSSLVVASWSAKVEVVSTSLHLRDVAVCLQKPSHDGGT